MNELNIIAISLALAIVFTSTVLPMRVKHLLKQNPFEYRKPWDCLFCMANWFAIITALAFAPTIIAGVTAWAGTIVIARLIDNPNK
jgi:hypothetical protein